MHELSIAQIIIEQADAAAREAGGARVRGVTCRVGILRQIDGELLRDAFAMAMTGTACDGAELTVESVGMTARCSTCGRRFEIAGWNWACPRCGAEGMDLQGGDELEIVSLDISGHTDETVAPTVGAGEGRASVAAHALR